MTPAYIAPKAEPRDYRFSVIRVIAMSLLLFLLVTVCLYLHHTAFREYLSYLTSEEKKSSAFMAEQFSYLLPFLAVVAFQGAVYTKHDRHDGVIQKEKAYEILILAALTYLVLLPAVWKYSDISLTLELAAGLEVEKNEGKEYETLFLSVWQWFVRFTIPLCLLFVYHNTRAKLEKQEAEGAVEASEPREAVPAEPTVIEEKLPEDTAEASGTQEAATQEAVTPETIQG